MVTVALRYDLRVPPFARVTHARLYRACLEQCAWADEHGVDAVVLSEHHGLPDGYLPAPLALAAAIAGCTRRLAITVGALVLPLHDPVRVAEELAVIALASGGRVNVIVGAGYREEEFAMAGVEAAARGRLLEEYLGVLRRAWAGEPFEWRGRRIVVTPRPEPPPLLMLGGSTRASARRAARLRLGFLPAVSDPELRRIYEETCREVGFAGGWAVLPAGPVFVHVSEDPEADWKRIAPHALYDAQTYASWQPRRQRPVTHVEARSADELRRSGIYRVLTPAECVVLGRELGHIVLHPLMGGLDPELAWRSLKLFASKVLPELRGG